MITVCCVCGKILKDDNVKDHLVSHGMCQECADKEREELVKTKKELKTEKQIIGTIHDGGEDE